MSDSPQMAAYRYMSPQSAEACSILRNGGTWEAEDPPALIEDYTQPVAMNATYKVHQFKARPRGPFGRVWHEVYSVETGEIVGHIN